MSRTTNSRAAPYVEPVGGGAGCVSGWRRSVGGRRLTPAHSGGPEGVSCPPRGLPQQPLLHFFRTHATAPLTCGAIAQEPAR